MFAIEKFWLQFSNNFEIISPILISQEISFRLQSKTQLIDGSKNDFLSARCDIVSSASTHGIVFVGSSNPELIIVCLRDLEAAELNVPVRKVPLPSPTLQIASNCDGSILAVALKINGTPHIQLYSVASFLTPVSYFSAIFHIEIDFQPFFYFKIISEHSKTT